MPTIKQYLARNGYTSVEDWAVDSDFTYDPTSGWTTEDGQPTSVANITEYLAVLISEGHTQ